MLKKIGTGIVKASKATSKALTCSKVKKVYSDIAKAGKATGKALTSSKAKSVDKLKLKKNNLN